ncbi:coq1 putative hexaprenyl diphosphate synthase [Microbotryomycetes sp. JL221]|nr:coq1 putative hexaprenyl diphosphate synthase [Microbotryomycetes sp. JL221]
MNSSVSRAAARTTCCTAASTSRLGRVHVDRRRDYSGTAAATAAVATAAPSDRKPARRRQRSCDSQVTLSMPTTMTRATSLQRVDHKAFVGRRSTSTTATRAAWTSTLTAAASNMLPTSLKPSTSMLTRARNLKLETDPLNLLKQEMNLLRDNVQTLLGSGHPALDTIAKYYFQAEGKHVRPMIVLLMSQATNGLSPAWDDRRVQAEQGELEHKQDIDEPLSPPQVLNDQNPNLFNAARSFFNDPLAKLRSSTTTPTTTTLAQSITQTHLLPSQRRLAEITEMIHVASLLHDDVIDLADSRRGRPSAPSLFGNKLSVLAGDFLLARASLALSRLGSNEVVELVASVLANLVEGEVMQMKGNVPGSSSSSSSSSTARNKPTTEIFDHYMKKTYLKTASLIAKSTRATTILGGCGHRQGWIEGETIKDIAYTYGRNLGIAFQLIDDMLDFTASASQLGKPGGGADLKLGLATAPALYAWEEFPELGQMIERKFSEPDDVEKARQLITKSSGAERTLELATRHSNMAREALKGLPDSEAKQALDDLAKDMLTRKK